MAVHIVLSRQFDVDEWRHEAEAGLRPRHVMVDVADKVDGRLHFFNDAGGVGERVTEKLSGSSGLWQPARDLVGTLSDEDVVFAPDKFGLLIVFLCCLGRLPLPVPWRGKRRPRLVIDLMVPTRPRIKWSLRCKFVRDRVDLWLVNSKEKVDFVVAQGVPPELIRIPPDVTDERFMAPAPHEFDPSNPVVVSAGREQRDYVTLAAAAADAPFRVRVCATSANASSGQVIALPDHLPPNMELRHFEWPEYRTLFQQADIVVIPLLEHDYSAGLTVMFEAFGFRKPVIVTATEGVIVKMVEQGLVAGVPVGDPTALRDAIERLLVDTEERERLAKVGHEYLHQHATTERYVEWMVDALVA